MKYLGIEHLRHKLECKRTRVLLRYDFYEMKNREIDFGISSPPNLQYWQSVSGWGAKAVDSLADRLVFHEFTNDNFNLNEIFQRNNSDVLFDSAILSALIASCSFIYISADENGYPRMQVIDGSNATGVIDPITNLLYEGYAVLERNDKDKPTLEAYFEPYKTTYIRGDDVWSFGHNVGYPVLVPIINRPDARRPFGHSRISRACMAHIGSALRTIKRSEIAAEFYSYPQKYVTGLSNDVEGIDKWKATMASMITFSKDEEGDHPVIGQFQASSMEPHLEQLRMFASLFGGETGLTLNDLGFASGNPESAEAIAASHENLRLTARKAQRQFGSGFLNAGFLAACLRDGQDYKREQLYSTRPVFEPVFEPDAATLSQIGDGAIKLNQAIPDFMNKTNLYELTGIE